MLGLQVINNLQTEHDVEMYIILKSNFNESQLNMRSSYRQFSLLNNKMIWKWISWQGSSKFLGSFPELSTAAWPLLVLLGLLSLHSLLLHKPEVDDSFNEHYTFNIPVKLPDHSQIMLNSFVDRLYWNLCQHVRCISSGMYRRFRKYIIQGPVNVHVDRSIYCSSRHTHLSRTLT